MNDEYVKKWMADKAVGKRVDVVLYDNGTLVDRVDVLSKLLKEGKWYVLTKAIETLLENNNYDDTTPILPGKQPVGLSFDIEESNND